MKNLMAWVIPISLLSAACGVSPSVEESVEKSPEKSPEKGTEKSPEKSVDDTVDDSVDERADEHADEHPEESAEVNVNESADNLGFAQQEEKWSSSDDPSHFLVGLERNINQLPQHGEASPIPWSGSYWRMSRDGIAYRWDGARSYSPARKYQAAFGGDNVEDHVSAARGVDSQRNAKSCVYTSDCNESLAEECGKRNGRRTGRCIPSWFGICNGWAASAILFPEPRHAVVHGGVTFKVQDIKALLSMAHTSTSARRVALRCYNSTKTGTLQRDAFGRPSGRGCRDTNPGTFHLLLANYLGLRRMSFVEDRTFDRPIWNQPLRGYDVLEAREVPPHEATRLVTGGYSSSEYRFNHRAKRFVYVKTQVSYIKESSPTAGGNLSANIDHFTGRDVYEYILELNVENAIIGGEWIGSSLQNHPDFLWLPLGPKAATVAGGAIRYDVVKALAAASVAPY